MQNEVILERIEGLRGRKSYEERKAAKLGFVSLYEYFEDKINKEANVLEAAQVRKNNFNEQKKRNWHQKKQAGSCSCC